MSAAITPGLHASFAYTVTDADTAAALESGLVPVLSTPRVLALAERATVEALQGALEEGATTVGAKVELEHLLATPVPWSGSRAAAWCSPSRSPTPGESPPGAASPACWWTWSDSWPAWPRGGRPWPAI